MNKFTFKNFKLYFELDLLYVYNLLVKFNVPIVKE